MYSSHILQRIGRKLSNKDQSKNVKIIYHGLSDDLSRRYIGRRNILQEETGASAVWNCLRKVDLYTIIIRRWRTKRGYQNSNDISRINSRMFWISNFINCEVRTLWFYIISSKDIIISCGKIYKYTCFRFYFSDLIFFLFIAILTCMIFLAKHYERH